MARKFDVQFVPGASPHSRPPSRRPRVAVVGAGAAGISAAYRLEQSGLVDVVLLEKRNRLGGHVHTHDLSGPDEGLRVDTGFIVMNDRNYPVMEAFLAELGIEPENSDMSFSFADRANGFEYNGTNLNTLFARRRNLASPTFLGMLRDILRFNKQAKADLPTLDPAISLGDYLDQFAFRSPIVSRYIAPMGAAIWSTSLKDMMRFPARSFVQFFDNHGLLSVNDRPQWKFLPGGSRTYVDAFARDFGGEIRTGVDLQTIRRDESGVILLHQNGQRDPFDHVILAAHADQSLALIEHPSEAESALLGAWQYSHNRTVLHHNASRMPSRPRAWASWNVIRHTGARDEQPVHLTYHMNRLQRLVTSRPVFVTLNDPTPFRDEDIIAEMDYLHPLYTREAIASQPHLPKLNGIDRLWFCGSYFGYGFHEDAIRAGAQTAAALTEHLAQQEAMARA